MWGVALECRPASAKRHALSHNHVRCGHIDPPSAQSGLWWNECRICRRLSLLHM